MAARPFTREGTDNQIVISSVAIGQHRLPQLPYAYNALEPFIDEETMRLHHTKHQQAYVDKLNAAEVGLAEARDKNDFKNIQLLERSLAFNGAGHANHIVFFDNLRPAEIAKPAPEGALLAQIQSDFGSLERLKEQFTQAAVTVEGSGWGALVYDPTFGRLYTLSITNHQNMTIPGAVPLLLVDVWEHAYYLRYQNRRPEYVKNWWNVVDWKSVETRFEKFQKCAI